MSIQEPMVDEPVRHRGRGSVWLGVGLSVAVMLGRLGIHFAVAVPPAPGTPEAAAWNGMYSVLQPLAVDPRVLFVGLFVLGSALSLIPRTRRLGVGMLLGTVVSFVGAVVLAAYTIWSLSGMAIEP